MSSPSVRPGHPKTRASLVGVGAQPRDAEFDAFDPDLLFKEASRPFAWRTACRTGFLLGNDLFFDETVKFGELSGLALRHLPSIEKNGPELGKTL